MGPNEQNLLVLVYITVWRPGPALKEKQDTANVLSASADGIISGTSISLSQS